MRRIRRLLYKYSIYLKKNCGLTTSQLLCLRALQREPDLSLSQLGRRVYHRPGTMTGIIDRLEAKGLVSRQRLGSDRRLIQITITGHGRNVVDKAFQPLRRLLEPELSNLSPDEKETITQSLERLLWLMQDEKGFESPEIFDGEAARVPPRKDEGLSTGEKVI